MSHSSDNNYSPSTPRVGTTKIDPCYAPSKENSYILLRNDNEPTTPRVRTTKIDPYYAPSKENSYTLNK
jgi:hypothetical protein